VTGGLIHNERIKLLAGAFNTIGLAFVIAGFVAPIVAGQASIARVLLGVLACLVGAALHGCSQYILGRLQE
jgi:hypothetical protein